jgi:hypothetical protein
VEPGAGRALPLRPRADSPPDDAAWQALGLSDEERGLLDRFAERGYAVFDLGIEEFEKLAGRIIADLTPRYGTAGRISDAWRISPEVKRLACLERVLRLLQVLYGRPAFPFQTLNFQRGTQQSAHSDTIHFHSFPGGFMAGVWIALEDVDEGNGPLFYYPGSHKLPVVTLADMGVAGSDLAGSNKIYFDRYEPHIRGLIERLRLQPEEALLKRGQALIWAANLLHGGSPIRQKGRSRQSQVTHYYFEDCIYYTPMWSDPALGRIRYRAPYSILTGRAVKSAYLGRAFQPPIRVRAAEWLRNRLHHVGRI